MSGVVAKGAKSMCLPLGVCTTACAGEGKAMNDVDTGSASSDARRTLRGEMRGRGWSLKASRDYYVVSVG